MDDRLPRHVIPLRDVSQPSELAGGRHGFWSEVKGDENGNPYQFDGHRGGP